MLAALLPFAQTASRVGSGAVLTLVLPLGITLVALLVWFLVLRHRGMLRAPRAPDHIDSSAAPPGAPAAPGPE
jgi:hypothetical protein